jgi:hypothetical protein
MVVGFHTTGQPLPYTVLDMKGDAEGYHPSYISKIISLPLSKLRTIPELFETPLYQKQIITCILTFLIPEPLILYI